MAAWRFLTTLTLCAARAPLARRCGCRARSLARMQVCALPANLGQEDSLDPERILRVLPDRERETFLAQYRGAVDGASDPAGQKHLQRFLRLWAGRLSARTGRAFTRRGPGPSPVPARECCSTTRYGTSARAGELPALAQRRCTAAIRRSWVRAPPAPPAVLIPRDGEPWTDAGGRCRNTTSGHIEQLSAPGPSACPLSGILGHQDHLLSRARAQV
jgi:Family of unknown function (DUF6247)